MHEASGGTHSPSEGSFLAWERRADSGGPSAVFKSSRAFKCRRQFLVGKGIYVNEGRTYDLF